MVETFLKNPEPPTWIPPDYVTSSDRDFLTSLRIPSYRNGNPSLLFHNLDVCDDKEIEMIFGPGAHQYVVINCALNTSQHVQAGAFATHLAREKPVACWKASRNTGDSTLLQLQIPTELASEIYKTPWTMSLSIRDGCPTLKTSIGERADQEVVNSQIASEAPPESPGCAHSRFPVVPTARDPGPRDIAGEA
jgi:hypothetical protein